jgi:hypothetical protein
MAEGRCTGWLITRRKGGDWRKGRSKPGIQKDTIAPEIQTVPVASNRLRSAGEVLVACGLREQELPMISSCEMK